MTLAVGSVKVRLRRRYPEVGYQQPKVLYRGTIANNPYTKQQMQQNLRTGRGYSGTRTMTGQQLSDRAQAQIDAKTQEAQNRGLDYNPAANNGKGAVYDPNNFADPNNPNGVKAKGSPNYGLSINPANGQPYDPKDLSDPNNPQGVTDPDSPNYGKGVNPATGQMYDPNNPLDPNSPYYQPPGAPQQAYGGGGGGGGEDVDMGPPYYDDNADYGGAGDDGNDGDDDQGDDTDDYDHAEAYAAMVSGVDLDVDDDWTHIACVDIPHAIGEMRVTGVGYDFASALSSAASIAQAIAGSPVMAAVLPPGTAVALQAVQTIAKAQATGGDAAAQQVAAQLSGPGGQRLQKALSSDSSASAPAKSSSKAQASTSTSSSASSIYGIPG